MPRLKGVGRWQDRLMDDGEVREGGYLFDPVQFGQRVQIAMDKEGLTFEKLEIVVNVARRSLRRIADGCPPSVEAYMRLMRWMIPVERRKT